MTATAIRSLLVVGLTGLLPGVVWLSSAAPRPESVPAAFASPSPPTVGVGPLGTAGCAAAACHGSSAGVGTVPDSDKCWTSSAVRWLSGDPHVNAYAALKSDRGWQIMAKLGLKKHDQPDEILPATEYDRCLACHTNPTLAGSGAFGLNADDLARVRADGVGCESCHGNSGPWLAAHTSTTVPYPPAGMADLNNVGERAKACAGCHVGAPADPARGITVPRDMNHDMIAAGHPRLNFELTSYQQLLPPHWFDRDRTVSGHPTRGSGFETTSWLVGRVAVAEAACELMADRANRAWPEFADADCFACHHTLAPESWRQKTLERTVGRTPGALPWQSIWPVTRPDDLDDAVPGKSGDVRTLLGMFMQRYPPPADSVKQPAADAAKSLAALRMELSRRGAVVPVEPLFQAAGRSLGRLTWDEAGQVYLGLAAWGRSFGPPYSHEFDVVRAKLSLTPARNSPDNYSPENVRSDLAGLIAAVRKKADADPPPGPK